MIALAVSRLRSGNVVAFATETVYGLGADTFNPAALERIYQIKGRPFNNPLIAHVLDWDQARLVCDVSAAGESRFASFDTAKELASRFWPGPLTLVLPKAPRVPPQATAGLATIAVRAPAHPVARKLLQAFSGPISAPSANRSGHVSPTRAQHVAEDFADADDLLILDGGASDVGIESTVLDLTATPPRILRPGAITAERLRETLGEVQSPHLQTQTASPGTASQHYAPHTPAELVTTSEIQDRLRQSQQPLAVLTFDASQVASPHKAIEMPRDAEEYARALYGALREADALGCERMIIESPPQEADLWRAITDRLRRAARPQ